jgi:hypothetical protein
MENTREILFKDTASHWYLARGQSEWIGPMTASEIYEKIQADEANWACFIWKEGQSDWKRICDVEVFEVAIPTHPDKSLKKEIQTVIKAHEKPAIKPGKRTGPPPGPDSDLKIWYLHYNDSQFGPFSEDEVTRFLRIGKIHARVHVWKDGMENWKKIEQTSPFDEITKNSESAKGKEGKNTDLRTAPRRPLVAKILMTNEDAVILAVCRDISVGGMQVLTDKVPGKMGTKIRMNVSPAGGTGQMEPFVAEGKIVRILEDGRGFSFRFERLSENAKRAIEAYIDATF